MEIETDPLPQLLITGVVYVLHLDELETGFAFFPGRAEALLPVIHRFNKLINEIAQALRVLLISYQIAEFSPLLFFLFNRHAMV